jgi:3-oxoadipate enol-lactonase
MPELAADVIAMLDESGFDRAHVAGISLGGTAALQFALDHPARIAGCVAADCVPHYPAPVAAMLRARVEEARASGMSAIVDGVLRTWFTEDARRHVPEIVANVRDGFVATPVEGYAMAVDALIGTDIRAGIRHIACPTLLVYGSADLPAMKDAALSMAGDIEGAQLLWLAGAHAAPIEQPIEFARAVADFVDTTEVGIRSRA